MPLSKEEMKQRWMAGIADIDASGGRANFNDLNRAIKFAQEQEEITGFPVDTVSLQDLHSHILEDSKDEFFRAPSMPIVNPSMPPTVLPSLPSISNVGSVPFTGTVSNIPGGFQPLPQVAGGKKKLYQLSQFHGGLNQKSSPRDIADFECQKATNVTVSSVGRIKLLGDIKGTDNNISTHGIGTPNRCAPGYGLFQFTAPADWDGANQGEYVLTINSDGDRIDVHDPADDGQAFIDFNGTDDDDTAHVFYASGNGVYVNDANFTHTAANDSRKAKIYVYREDAGSSQTVSGWKEGKPLIDSPTYDDAAASGMAAGDVKVKEAAETSSVDGSMIVECTPTGTGLWNGTYYFYVSWLFDGGVETGLTSAGDDDGADSNSDGIEFSNNTLEFNINLMHDPHATANTELGGDKRIEGGRVYFKKTTDTERFLLGEFNLIDGVKGALDSTFSPWTESSNNYSLGSDIVFEAPPEVYTYASLNGYYANEVYGESPDINADNATGPVAKDVRYKTAVVGSGGIVFIGNVQFDGKHMSDSMMFSMPGKPGVFPQYNRFDSPSSDGSPITALAAYRDTILQFKQNGMYVINVSNPAQFYAQASFRDCGVFNPCQVFTTSFGVIFANKNGCYIYDGQRVTSLTDGKFGFTNWDLPNTAGNTGGVEGSSIGADNAGVPCVGYDPRSQSIVVLKDINDNSTSTGAFVYSMVTQSWTEGNEMITNTNATRHTNFIITSGGHLSILRDDNQNLYNYSQTNNAQKVIFQTKDLDFGLPSQTKKLFKVYITYKGNASNLTATWRVNGSATDLGFTATNWADDSGTTDNEIAILVPDSADEAAGTTTPWQSMSLYITSGSSTVATDFEINDISILYRARPIK